MVRRTWHNRVAKPCRAVVWLVVRKPNGRVESILMSLPQNASWHYNYYPVADSPEEKTLSFLKKGIDWI